ncbi:MAG: hypothetical protein ABW092_01590 [Candidatus Thiodiazotropha sp.]
MPQLSVIYLFLSLILMGCGGGGDSSSGVQSDDLTGDSASFKSQALLGPVVEARVEIYAATDLSAGLLCNGMTVDSTDLDEAGLINIPNSCVNENGLYLLLVSGGWDIDADDDGVIDASPTEVRGRFHALITGRQLRAGSAKATALTEAAYQHVRYLLAAGASQAEILQALDYSATRLLKQDLNGDGIIDHQDLVIWHPRLDRDSFRPSLERLEELTNSIHVDSSTTFSSLRLHDAVSPNLNVIAGLSDADRLLINGSHLYVASSYGLHAVDISDVDGARLISSGSYTDLDRTTRMRMEGDRLYIEHNSLYTTDSGVETFDLSNPAAPEAVLDETYLPSDYLINRYTIAGDHAYVGMHQLHNPNDPANSYYEFRLDIIDISTPGSPRVASSIAFDSFISETVVEGDRLYVGTGLGPYLEDGRLTVFDISDVTAPRLINFVVLGSLEELSIVDDYAYAITRSENSGSALQVVSVFSLDRESGARLIGSLQTEHEIWQKKQLYMATADRGYMATPDGIAVIDFLDRTRPQVTNRITTNGATAGLALSGGTLFAAVDNYGVQSFDISNISTDPSPGIIDSIAIAGIFEFGPPQGSQIYAISSNDTDTSSGLFRIDLSDSQSPIISTSGTLPGVYRNLRLADNTLYVTDPFSGLTLFDISNPQSIDFHSTYIDEDAFYTSAFGIQGDVGVLGGVPDFLGPVPNWNLLSLDLSQAMDPLTLSRTSLPDQPDHIAMDGDLVFVSTYTELVIYRKQASGALSWLGALSFGTDSQPRKLIPREGYAYVIYGSGLLGILDISDPGQPREISVIETPGQVADITLSGDLLFIACNTAGLQVVDVTDPGAPGFVGNLPTQSPAEAVMVMNDRVYVATTENIVITQLPVIDVP